METPNTPSPVPSLNTSFSWTSTTTLATPSTPSATPPGSHNGPLKIWCDRLGNKFQLKPSQYSDLHIFVDVSIFIFLLFIGILSHFVQLRSELEIGDLRIRIIQQATAYQVLNAVEANKVEYDKFTGILEDVSMRLSKTFSLSKDQNVCAFFCNLM
jgi:hypothetical protein